jgi:hypothetical protein
MVCKEERMVGDVPELVLVVGAIPHRWRAFADALLEHFGTSMILGTNIAMSEASKTAQTAKAAHAKTQSPPRTNPIQRSEKIARGNRK